MALSKKKDIELNREEYADKINNILDRVYKIENYVTGIKEKMGIKSCKASLEKALKTIKEKKDNMISEKEKKKIDKQIVQLDN